MILTHSLMLSAIGLMWASAPEPSFRAGLVLGAPVGLSAALDLSPRFAAHLTLTPPSDRTELGSRLDLVYRPPDLGGELASIARGLFWFGAGLRWTLEAEQDSAFGLRVPFGFSVLLPAGEAELYAEIAPALVLSPELAALVEAGLGLRFGFF